MKDSREVKSMSETGSAVASRRRAKAAPLAGRRCRAPGRDKRARSGGPRRLGSPHSRTSLPCRVRGHPLPARLGGLGS